MNLVREDIILVCLAIAATIWCIASEQIHVVFVDARRVISNLARYVCCVALCLDKPPSEVALHRRATW